MTLLSIKNFEVSINKDVLYHSVNIDINKGDFIVIRGGNGSGKSTFFNILNSKNKKYFKKIKYKGEIMFENKDYLNSNSDLEYFRKNSTFIEQADLFFDKTALDEVINNYTFDVELTYEEKVDATKKLFSMFNKEYLLDNNPKRCSGGEKKIITILKGLIRIDSAKLLVIDEPLNNLDAKSANMVVEFIEKIHDKYPNLAIIIVSHCPMFKSANKIYMIKSNEFKLVEKTCFQTCSIRK